MAELQDLKDKRTTLLAKYTKVDGSPRKGVTEEQLAELQELTEKIEFMEAESAAQKFDMTNRPVTVGDVYLTTDRSAAVVVEGGDFFRVCTLPHLGSAKSTPWEKMKMSSRMIHPDTCAHHVEAGNWSFINNIADLWVK